MKTQKSTQYDHEPTKHKYKSRKSATRTTKLSLKTTLNTGKNHQKRFNKNTNRTKPSSLPKPADLGGFLTPLGVFGRLTSRAVKPFERWAWLSYGTLQGSSPVLWRPPLGCGAVLGKTLFFGWDLMGLFWGMVGVVQD